MIIDDLLQLNDDEILYKEYKRVVKGERLLEEFLEDLDDNDPQKQKFMDPDSIPKLMYEEEFMDDTKSVTLLKHNRFTPVFFHEHNFFETIYVLSGVCIHHFHEKKIILKRGDICMVAPNVQHGVEIKDEDSIILNILIRKSTFLDIFINAIRDKSQISSFFLGNLYLKRRIRYMIYHTEKDLKFRNYILDMYLEQMKNDDYSDRIISSMLVIFFAQLTRMYNKTVEMEINEKWEIQECEIINFIQNHYTTVTLTDIADHFHFSVPYCSKIIKSMTGYGFAELIKNIRMQQGESMLLLTQLSVTDISEKIGYANPETFIRVFKKQFGVSPSYYRKNMRH